MDPEFPFLGVEGKWDARGGSVEFQNIILFMRLRRKKSRI
jgi:hypothetical protein